MTIRFQARGASAEIWLYDQIGGDLWSSGITAKAFQKELAALGKPQTINLRINSPGGDVFDGLAIFNQLRQHPARKVVDVDGLAASIASVIAMAGDEIRIADNAMLMIHNPHAMAIGDAAEMSRMSALLSQIKGNLADTYAQRTGKPRGQLEQWMDDETWFTADDAVRAGFADTVTAGQPVSACFDLLRGYRHTPDALRLQIVDNARRPAREIASVRISDMEGRLHALI